MVEHVWQDPILHGCCFAISDPISAPELLAAPVSIPRLERPASPGTPAGRTSPDDKWHRCRAGVSNLPIHSTLLASGWTRRDGTASLLSYLASSEPRPLMNGFLVSWAVSWVSSLYPLRRARRWPRGGMARVDYEAVSGYRPPTTRQKQRDRVSVDSEDWSTPTT